VRDVRVTHSEPSAYVKSAFAALIDLLTCVTVQPLFLSALKWDFMSARLMLRMSRSPSVRGEVNFPGDAVAKI